MRLAVLPDSKNYAPTGRCIYCGATDTPLSKEHVIPRSLGGEAVIQAASCQNCAVSIQQYEAPCLNGTFFQARTFLKLPMYEPKFRPDTIRLGHHSAHPDGFPPKMVDLDWDNIPAAEHPAQIVMPIFVAPGILRGETPSKSFEISGSSIALLNGVPSERADGRKPMNLIPFNPDSICRLLAKIAHGAAVACLGERFEPLLPEVILGDGFPSYYVGCISRSKPATDRLHRLTLALREGYVVAEIQLFARYRIVTYTVVVGRPLDQPLYRHYSFRVEGRPTASP